MAEEEKELSGSDYRPPRGFVSQKTELARGVLSEDVSRRGFLQAAAAAATAAAMAGSATSLAAAPAASRHDVIAGLGDTIIPSDPGDPGYKDLEQYKITDEVLKELPGVSDADAELFNESAKQQFRGMTFLELGGIERAQYVQQIIDGKVLSDPKQLATLKRVFRNTRRRVAFLYYTNFPENEWPREQNGMPILKPGDLHQITNPNTHKAHGWDQSGFFGPLTWEEEERRRNLMKKVHWHEGWSPFDYQPEQPKKA